MLASHYSLSLFVVWHKIIDLLDALSSSQTSPNNQSIFMATKSPLNGNWLNTYVDAAILWDAIYHVILKWAI